MDVVPLTLIISLWLVFVFVVFFLQEHARGRMSSAERDSLLPLAEETPRTQGAALANDALASEGGQPHCPDCHRHGDTRHTSPRSDFRS